MRRSFGVLLALLAVAVGLVFVAGAARAPHTANAAELDIDDELSDIQGHIISGFAFTELTDQGQGQPTQHPTTYFPRGSDSCPQNRSSNIKVNQNCLNLVDPDLQGRAAAQNETFIAANPLNVNNLAASENDYRRGDGTCGMQYSLDGGRTWNETTVPNNFVRGDRVNQAAREYYQAAGDTSVAWDSKGNAYLSCQMFKRGRATSGDVDRSNGLYVFRSTQNQGASLNFPGRPVTENSNLGNNFLPLADKQFMAVDNNATKCPSTQTAAQPGATCTPFQDRIYVTWTEFAPDGTAFIYESYSADYGEHFSPRHLVGANSPLCVNDYGLGGDPCNENQDSQPFVGPDGVLYVAWVNFNNPETLGHTPDNRNQILLSKSVDGGNTFSAPVKVADFYDLPDCATYQAGHDFGRACVPEKGPTTNSYFRATNYPSGAVDPTNPAKVVVTVGSYINRHSKESNGCAPAGTNPATGANLYTGVKVPGACNNDIMVSVSTDGGNTFTGTTTDPRALQVATTDPNQATTDQWFQWFAITKTGKMATSYYDRQYGPMTPADGSSTPVPSDEYTGYSDFSLSASQSVAKWNIYRVSSSSMPPPTQFGGDFWGDYTGLAALTDAYPLWSDTRDPALLACADTQGNVTTPPTICQAQADNAPVMNDQNIYVAKVAVSSP